MNPAAAGRCSDIREADFKEFELFVICRLIVHSEDTIIIIVLRFPQIHESTSVDNWRTMASCDPVF